MSDRSSQENNVFALFDEKLSDYSHYLQGSWAADIHIEVRGSFLEAITPCLIIKPESISADEYEFVYDIQDWGNKLSTSKAEEMFYVGMSMCKLFYTIEKMIFILVERLKARGIDSETEIQVDLFGYPAAMRKMFESIINLNYNIVVTNFDPGLWGERFLEVVKGLSARGYGFLPGAPRDIYRQSRASYRRLGSR
jgi:hypothetical protein